MVVFWKQAETIDEETKQPKKVPILRYYNVFNADQVADLNDPDATAEHEMPFEPCEAAENIISGYRDGPKVEFMGKQAFYSPVEDLVRTAEPGSFRTGELFYATMFHELAHSTGHAKRLNRHLEGNIPAFGSPDYSREELVAEMGSAFLCAVSGISPPTIEQSAAYIAGWRKRLTDDRKLIISAAGAGQRAADWILGMPEPSVAQDARVNQPSPE